MSRLDLYNSFMNSEIPTDELLDKQFISFSAFQDLLNSCGVDDDFLNQIQNQHHSVLNIIDLKHILHELHNSNMLNLNIEDKKSARARVFELLSKGKGNNTHMSAYGPHQDGALKKGSISKRKRGGNKRPQRSRRKLIVDPQTGEVLERYELLSGGWIKLQEF